MATSKKEAQVKKPVDPVTKYVIYRSRQEEGVEFKIRDIRATQSHEYTGHLEWKVPVDMADLFDMNYHVARGRVARV
tara:strand:- start:37 stop:267 length:231 start_codon:yes stop_codon:yes gene_type:complete